MRHRCKEHIVRSKVKIPKEVYSNVQFLNDWADCSGSSVASCIKHKQICKVQPYFFM